MAAGELSTNDPRLLAAALLGSLTALGRQVAGHGGAAHALRVFRNLTDGLFGAEDS